VPLRYHINTSHKQLLRYQLKLLPFYNHYNIIQVNLHQPASPAKNQDFSAAKFYCLYLDYTENASVLLNGDIPATPPNLQVSVKRAKNRFKIVQVLLRLWNLQIGVENHDLLDRDEQVDECTRLLTGSTGRGILLRSFLLLSHHHKTNVTGWHSMLTESLDSVSL